MNWDWLLGPAVKHHVDGYAMRPSLVDLTTVKDVFKKLQAGSYESVTLQRIDRDGAVHSMVPEDLDSLSDWELNQVWIQAMSGGAMGNVTLPFHPDKAAIMSIGMADGPAFSAARTIAEKIVDENRPRFAFALIASKLLLLGLVVAVAAWGWFLLGTKPPASFVVTGSALVALVALLSVDLYRRQTANPPEVGHRIASFTRDQLRAERANSRANIKVASMTIPAGAIIGALVQRYFL